MKKIAKLNLYISYNLSITIKNGLTSIVSPFFYQTF